MAGLPRAQTLAVHDDSKVLMTRAGADVALLDVVDRDGDQDDED